MSMMSTNLTTGNWIVHRQFGVGLISGIEEKQISGKKTAYCRLDTTDGTVWVPLSLMATDRFRPVASRADFDMAIAELTSPAGGMSIRIDERKSRIKKVKSEHSLIDIARLARDLWVRQTTKSLTLTEQRALRHLIGCLVREWSLVTGLSLEDADVELRATLRNAHMQ